MTVECTAREKIAIIIASITTVMALYGAYLDIVHMLW